MPTYSVMMNLTYETKVEAETEEEANDLASEEFNGLLNRIDKELQITFDEFDVVYTCEI